MDRIEADENGEKRWGGLAEPAGIEGPKQVFRQDLQDGQDGGLNPVNPVNPV